MSAPSASSAIWLIARREIVTRAKTRSFVITTGALMLIIIVGSIIWSALSGGGPSTERVGLVGDAPGLSATLEASGKAAGTPIDVVTVPSEQQARDDVSSEDLDAAIVAGPSDQFVLLGKSGVDDTLAGIVHASIDQSVLAAGLAEHGVDPASLPRATIRTEETSPTKPDEGQRIVVALVGSILLMMAIMTGGAMVAVGVVEEKTSRIVEILLATVKPLHLLWGKILGIGLIALVQVVLLGATALIAGAATGLLTIAGTAIGMFAAVLVWFVLGFLFFAILYAATGALVSRQEELNSAITPLTVLSLAVLYAGIFGIQALDSTFITVLSWIPPFSAVLMPIRIATGDTDVVQVIVTVVLMIAACLLATWLSARIYQRSILRTGTRVSFREALSMTR